MRLLFLVVLSLLIFSCQKAQRDLDDSTDAAEDYIMAQTVYNDVYLLMRKVALLTEGISDAQGNVTSLYGCDVITVDTVSYPKTITMDFSFAGCGPGYTRGGRLIGKFYGPFEEPGSTVDIEFVNYFFEDLEIGGVLRAIYKDNNAAGNGVHSFFLQNGTIYDGDVTMTWTTSQQWEVITHSDETRFIATGSSNGVNRKGNTFFTEFTSPHVFSDRCLYILQGKADIEVINLSDRKLDYGEGGGCDYRVSVTINGKVHPVKVRFD